MNLPLIKAAHEAADGEEAGRSQGCRWLQSLFFAFALLHGKVCLHMTAVWYCTCVFQICGFVTVPRSSLCTWHTLVAENEKIKPVLT